MALPGGISEVDGSANSVEVESLAKFAVEEHNKKENALLEFVKVVNTKQQVVAGTMYYITLEATDGGQKKVYETKVWVKPWENFKQVQEFKLLGDGSANSLEVESLAKFAVEEHNKKENALLEFVKVVNTKQQVVAGTMYYITLEATDGGQKKVYETKVWVKPWENFKQVQEFKLLGDAPPAGPTC